jgi:hypothetical protein
MAVDQEQGAASPSDYRIDVSFPNAADPTNAEPSQGEGAAPPTAEAPLAAEAEAPIDLEADPFGETTGEGEQVVGGLGSIIKQFLKGGADDAATAGAKGADDVGTPPPGQEMSTDVQPPPQEGQVMPEVQLGTTRPLANPAYFEDPGSAEVLERLQAYGRTPPPEGWAQTKQGAETIQDITEVMGKPPSLSWSPAELLKLRQVADAQAKSVKQLADRLNEGLKDGAQPGAEDLAEFEVRSAALIGTQNAIAGLATEAGRILNSLQIRVDSPASVNRQIADIVRQRGGPGTIAERVRQVAEGANPHKDVQRSFAAKTWDEALKWRYNMMLSSVRSHVANMSGNTMSTVYEGILDIATVTNNRLMVRPATRLLAKAGLPVKVQEALPWATVRSGWAGKVTGARAGLNLAYKIATNAPDVHDATGGIGKWMNEMGMRVRGGEEALFGSVPSTPVRKAGVALSTPTRMLEAEDAFFRSVNYWGRLNTLAMDRAGVEAGGDLATRANLYKQYSTNPPDDMVMEARDYAAKLTYTSNPDIYGEIIGGLARAGKRISGHPVGNLILPFVNTPANLTGYVMEQMSAGVLTSPSQLVRNLLGQGTAREQAEAFAKVEIAAGIPFLLYPLWEAGLFTGTGSTNWATNQAMEAKGWKSGALQIDGTYYSLDRLDPMGQILAMYATAFEFAKEQDVESAGNAGLAMFAAVMSTADVLKDRAFLSSIVEFLGAVDKGAAGTKFMLNLTASTAGSFVIPGLVRDARMAADPVSRSLAVDYTTKEGLGGGLWRRFSNIMSNAYPAHSQALPPRIDWKGDIITNEGGAFWRGLLPIPVGTVKADDPTSWLLVNNVAPRKPSHKLMLPGTQGRAVLNFLDLDPEGHIYAKYQQIVGQERQKAVQAITSTSGFRREMELGNIGRDSNAGVLLSRALQKAKRAGDIRALKWLQQGGGTITVGGVRREYDLTNLPEFSDMVDAIKEFQGTGTKTEVQGLQLKKATQPFLPEQLKPQDTAPVRF